MVSIYCNSSTVSLKSHQKPLDENPTNLSELAKSLWPWGFLNGIIRKGFNRTSVSMPKNLKTDWDSHVTSLGVLPLFIVIEGFPCGSAGKESACNVGDLDSIPGLGRSPGEGKGYPLQYSGLENSMDCIVHGVARSWTQLNDFYFSSFFIAMEVSSKPQVLNTGCLLESTEELKNF